MENAQPARILYYDGVSTDPSEMGRQIAAFPERLAQGWSAAASLPLSPPSQRRAIRHVVVQGMGGSAIAGDIAAEAMQILCDPPVAPPRMDVFRDYGAHPAVGPETLVIIISHSGRTEEALSGLEASHARGAQIIALTAGGPLAEAAQRIGIPILTMPQGGGPPRTYLPYALGAVLRIFSDLDLAPAAGMERALADAVAELETRQAAFTATGNGTHVNPAMELAGALSGRIPVIVSAQGFLSAGRRWKAQLNENAKTPAWTEELPEMHHNAIVGFEQRGLTDKLAAVLLGPLFTDMDGERIHARYTISRRILNDLDIPTHWPDLIGTAPLSRLLEAALLGDYVSYYLALANGVDPMPTMSLDTIKEQIRRVNTGEALRR